MPLLIMVSVFLEKQILCLQDTLNADWAENADDRKSTYGGCFYVGTNLVAWISRKQASIFFLFPLQKLSILMLEVVVPSYCG
jgi:hypothetical protein